MPEIEIRQSEIGQLGVFTIESIDQGAHIRPISYIRAITPSTPLKADEYAYHCTLVDGQVYLVGEPDRYYNHSCDPNAYLKFETDRTIVVARRHIEGKAEITLDYLINNAGGDSWRCNCGALRCRGETGQSYFTLPEAIQHEYAPLLAPWFRQRHHAELSSLGIVCD